MKFHEAEIRAMKALGVPRQVIDYWVKDEETRPGARYAKIVAKVMGRSVEWVLYGDEPPKTASRGAEV